MKKGSVYIKTYLRIFLPNNYIIQAAFKPYETIGSVYAFINSVNYIILTIKDM